MTRRWLTDYFLLDSYRRLLTAHGRAKFMRALLLAALIGALEGVGLFAVIPTVTSFITGERSMGLTWHAWIGVFAVIAVLGAILSYLQAQIGYMAAFDLLEHLNPRVGDAIASAPLGWFVPTLPSRLSRLASKSIVDVGGGAAHFAGPILRGAVTTAVITVLSWVWAWQLGLALLLGIPVMIVGTIASRALSMRSARLTTSTEAELSSRVVEYCEAQPALRAAGVGAGYAPLHAAREDARRARRRALWLEVGGNMISGLIVQVIIVVLVLIAARLGGEGTFTPVAAIAFIGVSLRYSKVLEDISAFSIAVENARTPIDQFIELLDAPRLPEPAADAALTEPGTLRFDHVTFGYGEGKDVLRDVTFTAAPRTLTAIVGPSGAGKTTIFRLAARFWDVRAGHVSVGGVDVCNQPTEQLMSQLAMVFQDVYLYDTTLAENIRVGREDATDDEVRHAGTLAGVDEIAERLSGGWDAAVGEGGRRLSGGERQRVSVARALLKGAPVVLFDEATSALDPENEAQIERSIEQLRRTSTVLVIAHKLDTVRTADQIVVLGEDGRVAQVGTHEELYAESGLYRDLCRARERSEGWTLVGRDAR